MKIGTATNPPAPFLTAIFDSWSSLTTTLSQNCEQCTNGINLELLYDPQVSPTAVAQADVDNTTDGYLFQGNMYTDNVCLGDGDVHTTVCLDSQKFYTVGALIA